ncbi:hypothetical protein BDD43_5023 [Mucilaginibacter gracilis]|uniref:Uncharacterized protein n=1 Tax=Mucilaginibacter gracilis TaxID=423350 RepID=A0A495J7Q4_9SPHI|nr:hypothetical protein [Mucilaginibacter gracilis]RKR84771.1 hypothetical protein BDD43_5023 [Mucilaginibacter gracilis]
MTADAFYLTIILVLASTTFVYRIWTAIKANNIFMTNPSNKSADYLTAGPMAEPKGKNIKFIYGLAAAILIEVIGIGQSVYASLQPANNNTNTGINSILAGSGLMGFSLLMLIAVFLHTLMNEIDESRFPNYKYVFKVWFTTIFIAPVFLIVLLYAFDTTANGHLEKLLSTYPGVVVLTNGFGCLVLCGLFFDVHYLNKKTESNISKKINILILAEGIMLAVFAVFLMLSQTPFSIRVVFALLPYVVIMAFSIFYYNFDEPQLIKPIYESAEID